MSESRILDATGKRYGARVSPQNRLWTQGITEPIATARSFDGMLFGTGTGSITVTDSFSLGAVLWLRNDDPNHFFMIHKLIFGWNGGSTNFNRTVLSFIKYQTTVPTGANSDAAPAIENVSKSGTDAAVTDSLATAHKWDGTGTGMTGSTGGFLQIPNRLAQGNTSIPIDGEIVLGQNDTMALHCTPEETGLFNAAIVYYKAPLAGFGV